MSSRDAIAPEVDVTTLDRLAIDALDLCAIPAPTFAEAARAGELALRLRAAGLVVTEDPVGNVVSRIGADGPALAVCAHLDTVFGPDVPLEVRREGPLLRGPGIGDNALGLAALLYLARSLATQPPAGPILLVGTVAEEGLGDLRGATALVAREPLTGLLAIEGHGLDSIAVGGVASVRLRATFNGPGGHPWGDRGRASAIHAAIAAADRALAAATPAMVNIGTVEGGEAINAIAARAAFAIDLRHADPVILQCAEDRVRRILTSAGRHDIEVAIEEIGRRPGGRTDDGRMLLAAQRARRVAGLGRAWEHDASTDANAAIARGIPALTIGVSRGDNAHRPDEWVALPPAARGLVAIEQLVRDLAA